MFKLTNFVPRISRVVRSNSRLIDQWKIHESIDGRPKVLVRNLHVLTCNRKIKHKSVK